MLRTVGWLLLPFDGLLGKNLELRKAVQRFFMSLAAVVALGYEIARNDVFESMAGISQPLVDRKVKAEIKQTVENDSNLLARPHLGWENTLSRAIFPWD